MHCPALGLLVYSAALSLVTPFMSLLVLFIRLSVAAIFGFAAIGKIVDWRGTQEAVTGFGGPLRAARPIAAFIVSIEVAIAFLLAFSSTASAGSIAALAATAAMIVIVAVNLLRGRRPECHCFGRFYSAKIGWATVARIGCVGAMAGCVVAASKFGISPSFAGLWQQFAPTTKLALAAVSLIFCGLGAGGWVLIELFRQHGRLLVRLEAVESQLGMVSTGGRATGDVVGEPAPHFLLPSTTGKQVTLNDLLHPAKQLLLLFADPDCATCEALLPYLSHWENELSSSLAIAVVSRGGAAANSEKFASQGRYVLLQKENEVSQSYGCAGTPCGILVEPGGRIASSAAKGPQAIISLIQRIAPTRPAELAPSATVDNTRQPSISLRELVPSLRLIDARGKFGGIKEIAGESTLLIFWNPACPHCRSIAETVRHTEARPREVRPRLIVISISRETLDFKSRVLIDPDAHLMKSLGARSTPAAVLLDEETRLISVVAIGAENVLHLLGAVDTKVSV